MSKKQYSSNLMASIHETAEDLHEIGLMDKKTMYKFDEFCLTPEEPILSLVKNKGLDAIA